MTTSQPVIYMSAENISYTLSTETRQRIVPIKWQFHDIIKVSWREWKQRALTRSKQSALTCAHRIIIIILCASKSFSKSNKR